MYFLVMIAQGSFAIIRLLHVLQGVRINTGLGILGVQKGSYGEALTQST